MITSHENRELAVYWLLRFHKEAKRQILLFTIVCPTGGETGKMFRPGFNIVTLCFGIFVKKFVLVSTTKSSDFLYCKGKLTKVTIDGKCNLFLQCSSFYNPRFL